MCSSEGVAATWRWFGATLPPIFVYAKGLSSFIVMKPMRKLVLLISLYLSKVNEMLHLTSYGGISFLIKRVLVAQQLLVKIRLLMIMFNTSYEFLQYWYVILCTG